MSLILPLVIHSHSLLSLTPHHPPFRYNDAHTQHANDPLITDLSDAASQIKVKAALSAKQYMGVAAADAPSSNSSSSSNTLTTDQIMQLHPDGTGKPRSRLEIYTTAFQIQDAYQDHVKATYCGPGGTHKRAPIKKWERVYQKTERAYCGKVERCKDIVRSTLVFPDVASVLACLRRIEEDEAMTILNIKNRMDPAHSDASGYRDVALLLVGRDVTDNLIVELQLNTQSMFDAKSGGGHKRYVEARNSMGD